MDPGDLDGIPAAARSLWRTLLTQELISVHELFEQVHEYQRTLEQQADWDDSAIDGVLAQALVAASLSLLGTLSDDTPESARRLIQAAVRYFIIDDDGDADLESALGLDDDAEVMNAVLLHLGHDGWLIDIP